MGHKADWKMPRSSEFENKDEWMAVLKKWRADYNTCSECNSNQMEVRNYDEMWRDGDVYCENGHYVRMYDAG